MEPSVLNSPQQTPPPAQASTEQLTPGDEQSIKQMLDICQLIEHNRQTLLAPEEPSSSARAQQSVMPQQGAR